MPIPPPIPPPSSDPRKAIEEWANSRDPKPGSPTTAWTDLTAEERAEVEAILARMRANSRSRDNDPWGRTGGNGNIPLGALGIGCLTGGGGGGGIIPNPKPVVPSVPTPDLPRDNDTSTNGGTNRSPFAANPTNVTIRTNPSNVNTNKPSINRGTNGNNRGVSPRPGFTN